MSHSNFKMKISLVFGGAIYRRVFYVTNLGGLYLEGRIWRGLFSEYYGNITL